MHPRILVLSASVGAGHVRAAEAVELGLRAASPGAHILNLDVLTLTNALFRRVYARAYLDLVGSAPHLIGMLYDLTDRAPDPGRLSDRLRTLVQRVNLRGLSDLLASEPWDAIVNTHFLAPELLTRLARAKKPVPPLYTVVTDFDAHGLWLQRPVRRFFTATDDATRTLTHAGVDPASILQTGIPIHPAFSAAKGRNECRAKHALAADRPVVLLLAGGFGVGPVEELFGALLATEPPIHLVAVCGRNEPLRKKLARITPPTRHLATAMGFTREMDELMAASDLVVSKPGGLTTSECLARGVPMVVVNPIPGQESRNSDFLLEHGAAIKVSAPHHAPWKVGALLASPDRLARMRTAAASLGRPGAAEHVARSVLADLSA